MLTAERDLGDSKQQRSTESLRGRWQVRWIIRLGVRGWSWLPPRQATDGGSEQQRAAARRKVLDTVWFHALSNAIALALARHAEFQRKQSEQRERVLVDRGRSSASFRQGAADQVGGQLDSIFGSTSAARGGQGRRTGHVNLRQRHISFFLEASRFR